MGMRARIAVAAMLLSLGVLCGTASAQETFNSSAQPPPDEQFNGSDNSEDLHKYLSRDGRFIDRCAYEKDHPNANTVIYGQPEHFAPNQPMGQTESYNGIPAPYVSCAMDACPPNGTVCWRNPAAGKRPPPLRAAIEQQLQRQGCTADANNAVWCPPKPDPGGPPPSTLHGGLVKTHCHVTGTGVACDSSGPDLGDQFDGHGGGDQPAGDPKGGGGDQFGSGDNPGDGGGYGGDAGQTNSAGCGALGMTYARYAAAVVRTRLCTVGNDGEIWCRQSAANSGQFGATNAMWPMVPTGLRITQDCTTVRVPPPVKPPAPSPPGQTLAGQVQRVCTLQQLAVELFKNYDAQQPISRVKVVNGVAPDTYLLMFAGMQPRLDNSQKIGDALIALANVQALDSYRLGIMDAVQNLPKGSTLILVGHSQGGMEAMNAVESLVNRWQFKVAEVITYGSPLTADKVAGVAYHHVRERRDPIPALDREYNFTDITYCDAPTLTTDLLVEPNVHTAYPLVQQCNLTSRPIPQPPRVFKSACLELDVTTRQLFHAPNLFTRFIGGQINPHIDPIKAPRNPGRGITNCFWVSIAQDRYWKTGVPFTAACEAAPASDAEIQSVLERQYGGRVISDMHPATQGKGGYQRHSLGEPVPTNAAQVGAALRAAGPGSQGMVFIKQKADRPGHVVNARLGPSGNVEFFDAQSGYAADFMVHPNAQNELMYFYRTY